MIIEANAVNSTPRTPFRLSELDPRHVLVDLFEEELLPDPEAMADTVIRRLRDAGFTIKPLHED